MLLQPCYKPRKQLRTLDPAPTPFTNFMFTDFLSTTPPTNNITLPVQSPPPPINIVPPFIHSPPPPPFIHSPPPLPFIHLPPPIDLTGSPPIHILPEPVTSAPPPASFTYTPSPTHNNVADPVESVHKQQNGKQCKKKYTLNKQFHSPTLTDQLQQMEKYWTQPNYLLRKEPVVNQTTFNKRKERILCFMGFCVEHQAIPAPDLRLFDTNQSAEHRKRYETFLGYLKNDRHLNNGTIVEHITAAIFALKFLFAR
jgi:hypothetical protein